MKFAFNFSFFLIIFLFSCSGKKNEEIITYKVRRSDLLEKITIPGTVQAVVNTPVIPPRSSFGQMTIVRLAQDGAYVRKGDTICVLTSPDIEKMYNDQLTSIETMEAQLTKAEADNQLNIAMLEAQLATSEAQLKIANLDSLQLKYSSEERKKLLGLEMEKAQIEKRKTGKKLAATKAIGESDLRQKRAMIMQEKVKAQSYLDQLKAMTIIAQRDGMVQRATAPRIMLMSSQGVGVYGGPMKEGSVLLLSSPILQFPDLSRMQISADAAEADFKKIEKGQKALITVDAANKLYTTGKVNRKSLAMSMEQRYSDSKVRTYEIIIDVDSCHSLMKPGLSARCEIILNQASDTLFVPTLSVFERDSSKVVYVKTKEKFLPVKVETGASGSSYTIIPSGLRGGEEIALSEPSAGLIIREKAKADQAKIHNQN